MSHRGGTNENLLRRFDVPRLRDIGCLAAARASRMPCAARSRPQSVGRRCTYVRIRLARVSRQTDESVRPRGAGRNPPGRAYRSRSYPVARGVRKAQRRSAGSFRRNPNQSQTVTNRIINMKSNRRMLRHPPRRCRSGYPARGCAVGPDFRKPRSAGCQKLLARSRCRIRRVGGRHGGGRATFRRGPGHFRATGGRCSTPSRSMRSSRARSRTIPT